MKKIDFFLIFTKSWTQNGPKWIKMSQDGLKMHPKWRK